MQRKSIPLETDPYKGVRDFYPEEQFIQVYIFNTWRKVVESFGYEEYAASILEPAELYKAKSGEEIVNEQTYTFTDRGEREVTLRPEMTPTVARMVAKKRRELGFPLRLYSIPNLFRYERPQKGRLREHWQLNVDLFGSKSIYADIEPIEVAAHIMSAFGAKSSDYVIKVSSRKLLNALFSQWYELEETKAHALKKLIDKKNKIPAEDFDAQAEQILGKPFEFLNFENKEDGESGDLNQALAIPTIRDAYNEIKLVIDTLKARGIPNVEFDQTLIRGFDYYTGIIFELFDTYPENNRALFGGGRYDELLSLFGPDEVPACGFGMGDVTMADFLAARDLLPPYKPATKIMVCPLTEEDIDGSQKVAEELRAKGIGVAVNLSGKSVGDQIKNAEKLHIPYVIVIGPDEVAGKAYKIKNLESGTESDSIEEIV